MLCKNSEINEYRHKKHKERGREKAIKHPNKSGTIRQNTLEEDSPHDGAPPHSRCLGPPSHLPPSAPGPAQAS